MKRRRAEPRPASRDAIKNNSAQFITELPKRYRNIESGYNRSLYAMMAECAILAQLAAEEPDIADEIRNGKHWKDKRQQCPEDEYVKLVVHHMLQPEGRNEQSKASKWTAVIEHLSGEESDGSSIVEALSEAGGIEEIYAETTGRNDAKTRSVSEKACEKIDGDIEIGSDFEEDEAEVDQDEVNWKRKKRSKAIILEVMLELTDLNTTLDAKVVDLRLTIGGAPVPDKPEGYKRVVGIIKRIIK